MKSCFFIGHRDTPESILPMLLKEVEHHIMKQGVAEFIVGNYGAFDRLSARAVITAKQHHPEITLLLLLPYHPSIRPVEVPPRFDGTYYPEGMESIPPRFAISRANRYMVDHVDYLIAYAWHPASNARNLPEYAQKREGRNLISVTVLPRS